MRWGSARGEAVAGRIPPGHLLDLAEIPRARDLGGLAPARQVGDVGGGGDALPPLEGLPEGNLKP